MIVGSCVGREPRKGTKTQMPFKRLPISKPVQGAAAQSVRAGLRLVAALTLLLCLHGAQPRAQERILDSARLLNETKELSLVPYTIMQPDPEGRITPESIVSSNGKVLSGKIAKGRYITLGHDGTPVWLSIKLNDRSDHGDWIIDFGRRSDGRLGRLKEINAYDLKLGSEGKIVLQPLKSSASHGVYKLRMANNEQKLILFHLRPVPGMPGILPLNLYDSDTYVDRIQSHAMYNTAYCLILMGFGVFFIALALARRIRSNMIFGFYFLFAAAGWIFYDTIATSTGAGSVGLIIILMMTIYGLLSIYSIKVFCGIEKGGFSEKYVLYALIGLNLASAALLLALREHKPDLYMGLVYGPLIFTLAVLTMMSLAQARNGQLPGLRYFISWLVPLIGMTISVLSAMGILIPYPLLLNAFWISLPLQAVFVFLAIQQKISRNLDMPLESTIAVEQISLSRLRETKENADHTRLLKVIEKEREMLGEFRTREATRTQEMRLAKEEADEANRAKSAFLAVVSHEIRTPMTGIMGMVRLLLDSNINKQQREYALTIQESSESMLGLLNDILDFEKIQRGKIELENISFDLHRLIQGVITLMSGHAAQKSISLSARIDENIPRFVKGDPTRLRQVLLNLMGNGIKFTEQGSVTLMVRNLGINEQSSGKNGADRYSIYFAIQDTGIGIDEEGQKNLFNPFSQASASINRKFGGSGLGLAICKGLVERMGSALNINTKHGEGSTFFFTVEMEKGLAISGEQSRKVETERVLAPLRILVVDDNEINRKVISGFLEKTPHMLTTSHSAEDALTKINAESFDLVLMDIELPGIRGNEATRLLRSHADKTKADIPVFAITGNIEPEDKERYVADGMNGFVAKPIDADKLVSMVNDVAAKAHEREIRAPGEIMVQAPILSVNLEEDDDFDSFAQTAAPPPSVSKKPVQMDGVFNPDMLQSLKDTIGLSSLNELLGDLIVKTEEIVAAMLLAVEDSDLSALAARAHELKGMAGNFGLTEISFLAAQAEQKAKHSETDELQTIVESLPAAKVRAQTVLKDWAAH